MRKHYTIALAMLALSATAAQAQLTKGKVLLGPELGFFGNDSNTPNSSSESSGWQVGALVGVAVSNRQVWGGQIMYGRTTGSSNVVGAPGSENSGQTFSGGVFYRHYVPLGGRFFFFGQANLLANVTSSESRPGSGTFRSEGRGFGVNLGVQPAFALQLTPSFHMELLMPNLVQMNYNRTKSTDYNNNIPAERTGSNYGLSTDFTGNFLQQTNVGFRFWL